MSSDRRLLHAFTLESELGCIAFITSHGVLRQMTCGHPSAAAAWHALDPALRDQAVTNAELPALASRLQAFAGGADDDFRDVQIDLSGMTPFQRRVIQRCRKIPRGQTLSYGALAAAAGSPGAARAVGNVMSSNCYPLIVPCHRVVNSNGSLGNYSGPQGTRMKARLLQLEQKSATFGRTPTRRTLAAY